jgi:hypothetical protein
MKNYFLYIVTLLFATTALAQQKILLPKVTKISAKNMPMLKLITANHKRN